MTADELADIVDHPLIRPVLIDLVDALARVIETFASLPDDVQAVIAAAVAGDVDDLINTADAYRTTRTPT